MFEQAVKVAPRRMDRARREAREFTQNIDKANDRKNRIVSLFDMSLQMP
jgi:hypothetical protein